MASNTGCVSVGEPLIAPRISAVCRSSASSRSRVSRATSVSILEMGELGRPAIFGALPRFHVLGRCAFAALPPVLLRRLIASPEAQDRHRSGQTGRREGVGRNGQCPLWVKSRHLQLQKVMSALPPIADMCGANTNVRFVPIADIASLIRSPRRPGRAARAKGQWPTPWRS